MWYLFCYLLLENVGDYFRTLLSWWIVNTSEPAYLFISPSLALNRAQYQVDIEYNMLNWSKFLSLAEKAIYEPVEKILRPRHSAISAYRSTGCLPLPLRPLAGHTYDSLRRIYWSHGSRFSPQVGKTGSPREFMAVTESHLLVANTPAFLTSFGKTLMCVLPEFPGALSCKPWTRSCTFYYLPSLLIFLSFLFWCFPGLPLKYWIVWPLIIMQ